MDALRARLTYEQQRKLDELAPTNVRLPTGSSTRIDYLDDNAPIASMRMHEVFGLAATPRIGGGAVPVTFTLLSPGRKPLQITRDLASFWLMRMSRSARTCAGGIRDTTGRRIRSKRSPPAA
jgi:ATP-dependent helicase HrpB